MPPATDEVVEEKREAGAKAPTLKSPKLRKLQQGSLPNNSASEIRNVTGKESESASESSQGTDATQVR